MSNSKYLFNNISYNENTKIGVNIGSYTLKGIPEGHPIGFVTDSDFFNVIGGDDYVEKTVDDINNVKHYTGDITLEITGKFDGEISYHCSEHEYMGGENRIIFSSGCPVAEPEPEPEPEPRPNRTRPNLSLNLRPELSLNLSLSQNL